MAWAEQQLCPCFWGLVQPGGVTMRKVSVSGTPCQVLEYVSGQQQPLLARSALADTQH